MKQLPLLVAALAAAAAIGAPATQAADTQSSIIVAQATSPGDPNHPSSQPAFARQGQEPAAQTQQPAQSAAQPQLGAQPTAQSQQQRRPATAQSPRRGQPATTGSGGQAR